MKIAQTGHKNQVFFTVMSYRVFLPYGRMAIKSTYSILLNYGRKMLINSGVIENQPELNALLASAGIKMTDLDIVVNMSYHPEHIGQNATIQFQNPGVEFFAHPDDAELISDTAYQHEKHYSPGFYRLVAGNTINLNHLQDGQVFDLLGEHAEVKFSPESADCQEKFSLYLPKSGLTLGSMAIETDETVSRMREAFACA